MRGSRGCRSAALSGVAGCRRTGAIATADGSRTWPIGSQLFTLLVLLVGTGQSLGAADVSATWTGGTGNWTSTTFWSYAPPSGALFPNNSSDTFAVSIDGGNTTNSVVLLNTSVGLASLDVGVADRLVIENNQLLTLTGAFTNNGEVRLADTGSDSPTALTVSGPVTYAGTGVFSGTGTTLNRLTGATAESWQRQRIAHFNTRLH